MFARDASTGKELIDVGSWPRRPPPESTGRHYDAEIFQFAELRTVRAQLQAWVQDRLGDLDADGAVLGDLLLAVEELASNGLRHGGAPEHAAPESPRRFASAGALSAEHDLPEWWEEILRRDDSRVDDNPE
jgi:hypothetical protein